MTVAFQGPVNSSNLLLGDWALTALGLLILSSGASAQETLHAHLGGSVSKVARLDVDDEISRGPMNSSVLISGQDSSSVRLLLHAAARESSRPVRIPLILRSNCEVQVTASSGAQGLSVKAVEARPGGPLVHREALAAALSSQASTLREIHGSLVVFESPRISAGGFRNSPSNALYLAIEFTLPADATGQPLEVTLVLKPK